MPSKKGAPGSKRHAKDAKVDLRLPSKSAIHRLTYRAGIPRTSADCIGVIRDLYVTFLTAAATDAARAAVYTKVRTVTAKHAKHALRKRGIDIHGTPDPREPKLRATPAKRSAATTKSADAGEGDE